MKLVKVVGNLDERLRDVMIQKDAFQASLIKAVKILREDRELVKTSIGRLRMVRDALQSSLSSLDELIQNTEKPR